MSAAPSQGIEPHRRRRHHRQHDETIHPCGNAEEARPKVNPIFLWASQCEQRIIEVRCEDYDKRNRIKLTKTAQGWRSIPRTASNSYAISAPLVGSSTTGASEKENNLNKDQTLRIPIDSYVKYPLKNLLDSTERTTDLNGVRRKRKKYHTFVQNRKRRRGLDVTSEKSSGESKLSRRWKSKRRRKVGKRRRVTRITKSEEDMDDEDDETEDEKKQEKIMQDVDLDRKRKNDKESNQSEVEKTISETVVKNCSDIEKMTKNRFLQPRVVLEQLRLSQLPKRVYRNSSDTENEDLLIKNRNNSADADNRVNYENEEHNDADDEAFDGDEDEEDCEDERLQCDKKSTVMAKDDLQEILNMLDANDFSHENLDSVISMENNKTIDNFANNNCLESENCVKLMEKSKSDVTVDNFRSEEKLPNLVTSLSYFISEGTRENIEQSEVLDTAKNEERQIACDKEPNCAQTDHSKNSNDSLDETLDIGSSVPNITTEMKTISSTENKSLVPEKTCYSDSSSILKALQSTPGLSISIATKPRSSQHTDCLTKKAVSSSLSPDSQTEIPEKSIPSSSAKNIVFNETTNRKNLEMKNMNTRRLPEISIAIPVYKNLYQKSHLTIPSPDSKNRVESPESTTANNLKPDVSNHTESHEFNEVGEYDLQTLKVFENHNSHQTFQKPVCKNIPQLQPIDTTRLLTYFKSKVHVNSPTSMSKHNNEAQAKMTNNSYRDAENKAGIKLKSRNLISLQPFDFNGFATAKSESENMTRILPSPPCSVSCSEDAKNNITFKNFLLPPQNSNLLDESISTLSHHINVISKMNEELSKSRDEFPFIHRLFSNKDMQNPFAKEQVPHRRPTSTERSDVKNLKKMFPTFQNKKQTISAPNKGGDYPSCLNTDVDPSSQLRDLIKTSGHLIPDPLLVPRDYLPSLAAAPAVEIPKLLLSRPELRLPEAFSKPELLRDPNLLVISLAHLQQVLDQNDSSHLKMNSAIEQNTNLKINTECKSSKPKLSCKPIGTLMPSPMDLSNNRKQSPCPPLLRVRSGLMKQESEVSSTANSPDDMHLWHPLFGR